MTNISLYNRNPVELAFDHASPQPPEEPALTILDGQGIPCLHTDADRFVFVELDAPSTGLPETTVIIRSETHDLYVWEQTTSGHSLWPRQPTRGCYRTYAAPETRDTR